MPDFFKELNSEQLDAVVNGNGPCLVLAGAGSGKTRVITYRVAYLLEQGVKPENILLVTFTNKAAGEMIKRIGELVLDETMDSRLRGNDKEKATADSRLRGNDSEVAVIPLKKGIQSPVHRSMDSRLRGNDSENATADSRFRGNDKPLGQNDKPLKLPWAGTFHHIAYKILRFHAPLLGFSSNFTILDGDDSEALIKICSKSYKTVGGKKFPSASVLRNLISYTRNAQIALDEVLEIKYPQFMELSGEIKAIADDYTRKKKEANAMDFDDLLVNFLLLLNHSDIRAVYAKKFQYILVDEYQDTNKIQASIIDHLAGVHKNLLVVGDDAQSIYSFRAANVENILNFEKKYPDAKIFRLETNYRSSQEILDLANNVIANNSKQYKKVLKTLESTGVLPELHPRMDQMAEADFVAKKIKQFIDDGVPHGEIAVLFRAAYHSQMLEMQLMRAGIAYDYRGGLRFFERAHVKDILSYLRVLNNLADTAAWLRILMKEEGIGPAGAQKLIDEIKKTTAPEEIKNIGFGILGERAKEGWNNFVNIWDEMIKNKKREPAEMIRIILGSNYQNYLENEYIDAEDRMKDLEQLAVFAEKYGDTEEFLAEASLQESFSLRGSSGRQKETGNDRKEKIILSTIHQAKGLEWHAVFVLNLSNGGFPNDRALREAGGLEEERRLFYVAITRAKRNLTLTYPMASGGAGDFLSGPSMFLSEISEDLLNDHSLLNYNNSTVLDDEDADVHYVSEDAPVIKPGSFLRSLEDL